MKLLFCSMAAVMLSAITHAQVTGFRQWYPVSEDADLHYKTSYSPYETILFEANPQVRYSFYNNMRRNIGNTRPKGAWAVYIAFKPQFRMYTDTSLPVKTPTYKAQLGVQKLFKLRETDFLSVALESGHFSNGQSGSSFSDKFADGSYQGDSMYTTIHDGSNLSEMLNRRSGNFSTNITELNFNFRHYSMYMQNKTRKSNYPHFMHSATLGFVLYNDRLLGIANIGGYSDDDIKLYGHMRYQLGYEFTWVLKDHEKFEETHTDPKYEDWSSPRISFSERIELISGAHPSVNPFRSHTRVSYAPAGRSLSEEFQVFMGLIVGHDNYNFRFVDSGTQFEVGLSWTVSPPPRIGVSKMAKAKKHVAAEDDTDDGGN